MNRVGKRKWAENKQTQTFEWVKQTRAAGHTRILVSGSHFFEHNFHQVLKNINKSCKMCNEGFN